jgi:hypothetical protein
VECVPTSVWCIANPSDPKKLKSSPVSEALVALLRRPASGLAPYPSIQEEGCESHSLRHHVFRAEKSFKISCFSMCRKWTV